jgi:hypothetical protein
MTQHFNLSVSPSFLIKFFSLVSRNGQRHSGLTLKWKCNLYCKTGLYLKISLTSKSKSFAWEKRKKERVFLILICTISDNYLATGFANKAVLYRFSNKCLKVIILQNSSCIQTQNQRFSS